MSLVKYAPAVFNHIRKFDGILMEDILKSLNPDENLICNMESVVGGRSESPISFTHDKKYLLKIIPHEEKRTLIKILASYHEKMIENKTLLCRIYGLFSIIVRDKQVTYLMLMKNMNTLPLNVLNIFI